MMMCHSLDIIRRGQVRWVQMKPETLHLNRYSGLEAGPSQ
jgi:hypothetical protein